MPPNASTSRSVIRNLLRRLLLFVAIPVAAFACIKYLSEGEYRRLERERVRLCDSKAALTVHEVALLPRHFFDASGRPNFTLFQDDKNGLGYIAKTSTTRVDGTTKPNGPTLLEHRTQVIKLENGKVIAERVTYWRYGGKLFSDVLADIGGNEGKTCFDAGLGIPYVLVFKPEG